MDFQKKLYLISEQWSLGNVEDEWLFEKIRSDDVGSMTSAEAFGQIGQALKLLSLQSNESTAIEILETVHALIRKSETTEIPDELKSLMKKLSIQFSFYDDYAKIKLKELFCFYKLELYSEGKESDCEI